MTDFSQLPIIQCAYEFALEIHRLVGRLPRTERLSMGAQLAESATNIVVSLGAANEMSDFALRTEKIDATIQDIFLFRLRLRMLRELRAISVGESAKLNARIEILNRELIAWRPDGRSIHAASASVNPN